VAGIMVAVLGFMTQIAMNSLRRAPKTDAVRAKA
jgi:hypothetical protein